MGSGRWGVQRIEVLFGVFKVECWIQGWNAEMLKQFHGAEILKQSQGWNLGNDVNYTLLRQPCTILLSPLLLPLFVHKDADGHQPPTTRPAHPNISTCQPWKLSKVQDHNLESFRVSRFQVLNNEISKISTFVEITIRIAWVTRIPKSRCFFKGWESLPPLLKVEMVKCWKPMSTC